MKHNKLDDLTLREINFQLYKLLSVQSMLVYRLMEPMMDDDTKALVITMISSVAGAVEGEDARKMLIAALTNTTPTDVAYVEACVKNGVEPLPPKDGNRGDN